MLRRWLSTSVRERAAREMEARAVLERAVSPALAAIRSVMAGDEGGVVADLALRSGATPQREALVAGAEKALSALPWVRDAHCSLSLLPPRRVSDSGPASLASVSHVLGVSSCKGGVGKSTIALNLAFALARLGGRVGLLDADLYGPSLPTMVTLPEGSLPVVRSSSSKLLRPPEVGGVKLMSFGFVAKGASEGKTSAAIVRGPLASTTVQQLAAGTDWGELDYLIIDMPPGTGDIMLTLCQSVGITGAVVVTTPGKLAAVDTLKGIELLQQTKIPILAIVENMAFFREPATGVCHRLFGASYARALAEKAGLLLPAGAAAGASVHGGADGAGSAAAWGGGGDAADVASGAFELPIEPAMGESLEAGHPLVLSSPDSAAAAAYGRLAECVALRAQAERHAAQTRPDVRYRPSDGAVVLRFLSGPREGHEYAVPAARLRAHALDALSVSRRAAAAGKLSDGDGSGERGVEEPAGADGVKPLDISPRGNYGVAIRWSDGHESAIFPYEQILELANANARQS